MVERLEDAVWELKDRKKKGGGWRTRGTGGLCEPVYDELPEDVWEKHALEAGGIALVVRIYRHYDGAKHVKGMRYPNGNDYRRVEEIVLLYGGQVVERYDGMDTRVLDGNHDAQRLYALRDMIKALLEKEYHPVPMDYERLRQVRPKQ